MGEYSYAKLRPFGVEGHETEVAALFAEHGFKGYELDGKPTDSIADGVEFINEQARIGIEEWVGFGLRELGVSYELQQDGKYEYDGFVEMFTPELGTFSSSSSDDTLVLVSATSLDRAIDTELTCEALGAAIEKLTGRAWRRHFEQLTKALKAEEAA